MNPTITKMEDFTIIFNVFESFTIVVKSPVLTVVWFLDPVLNCNKFAL